MPLQQRVGTHFGWGIPGDPATNEDIIFLDCQPQAQGDKVKAGNFAWPGSIPETTCIGGTITSGVNNVQVMATPTSGSPTTGTLTISADGTNPVTATFNAGTFTSTASTATSVTGTLAMNLSGFQGSISIGDVSNVVTVANNAEDEPVATINADSVTDTFGSFAITAATATATTISLTFTYTLNQSAQANPLGIVYRSRRYVGWRVNTTASLYVPEGEAAAIVIKGQMRVQTTTDATYDQAVFARQVDGAIITGTAGETIDGAVETNWRVRGTNTGTEPSPAGTIILIENWS